MWGNQGTLKIIEHLQMGRKHGKAPATQKFGKHCSHSFIMKIQTVCCLPAFVDKPIGGSFLAILTRHGFVHTFKAKVAEGGQASQLQLALALACSDANDEMSA